MNISIAQIRSDIRAIEVNHASTDVVNLSRNGDNTRLLQAAPIGNFSALSGPCPEAARLSASQKSYQSDTVTQIRDALTKGVPDEIASEVRAELSDVLRSNGGHFLMLNDVKFMLMFRDALLVSMNTPLYDAQAKMTDEQALQKGLAAKDLDVIPQADVSAWVLKESEKNRVGSPCVDSPRENFEVTIDDSDMEEAAKRLEVAMAKHAADHAADNIQLKSDTTQVHAAAISSIDTTALNQSIMQNIESFSASTQLHMQQEHIIENDIIMQMAEEAEHNKSL